MQVGVGCNFSSNVGSTINMHYLFDWIMGVGAERGT